MQKLGEGSRLVTEEIQGHGDLSLQQNLSNRKWAVLETTSLEGDIAYSWSNDQNVFFCVNFPKSAIMKHNPKLMWLV